MVFFTGIVVWGWIHPKNKIGVELMAAECKCPCTFLPSSSSVEAVNFANGNFVIVTDKFFPQEFIQKQFVIYGPHLNSPIATGSMGEFAKSTPNQIFNCLSQWNVGVQKLFNPPCQLVALPFPVETQKFTPGPLPREKRAKTFLYLKQRHPDIVKKVREIFSGDFTFIYGKYKEDDYLSALKECRFGVWVGRHESQGFALEEALSCDVPLLLVDVTSMADEVGTRIHRDDKSCAVTAAPYWDDRCGIKIKSVGELESALKLMVCWTGSPRSFVEENLSAEVCAKRFQELF